MCHSIPPAREPVIRLLSSIRSAVLVALALVILEATPAGADPGELDPTYGGTGVVRTPFRGHATDAQFSLVQTDGRILVVGTQGFETEPPRVAAARYLTDGTLDPSWGGDGRASVPGGSVTDAALDPGGRLVVSFWHTTKDLGATFGVARFDLDGSPDETFGDDGRVTTALGDRDAISWAVETIDNGKVVAAGQALSPDGNELDVAIARYRTDGTLDPHFSGNGWAVTKAAPLRSIAFGVAAQEDNALVVAGIGLADAGSEEQALLARYTNDGPLDDGFGQQGVRLEEIGEQSRLDDVEVLGSGKLIVGGQTGVPSEGLLARFTTSGALDGNFGSGGVVISGESRLVWDVESASYGKLAAGGVAVVDGEARAFVARYDRDGTPDANFAGDGSATDTLIGRAHEVRGVAVGANGSIVVAVSALQFPGRYRLISARYIG